MKMRNISAVVVMVTTLANANGAWATLLPTAQIGDTFSGVIQINPNAAIWEQFPSFVTYGVLSSVGTFNVSIGGFAFPTQQINSIDADASRKTRAVTGSLP